MQKYDATAAMSSLRARQKKKFALKYVPNAILFTREARSFLWKQAGALNDLRKNITETEQGLTLVKWFLTRIKGRK